MRDEIEGEIQDSIKKVTELKDEIIRLKDSMLEVSAKFKKLNPVRPLVIHPSSKSKTHGKNLYYCGKCNMLIDKGTLSCTNCGQTVDWRKFKIWK